MVKWVLDFLTCRPQAVRANGALSQKRLSATGSAQGCVLSSLLCMLYANDCRSNYDNKASPEVRRWHFLINLLQDRVAMWSWASCEILCTVVWQPLPEVKCSQNSRYGHRLQENFPCSRPNYNQGRTCWDGWVLHVPGTQWSTRT